MSFPGKTAGLLSMLVLLPLVGSPLTGQDKPSGEKVSLRIQMQKGDKITQEGSVKLALALDMNNPMGGEEGQKIHVTQENESKSKVSSEVLEVTDEKQVRKELREYVSMKDTIRSTNSMMEGQEEPEPMTRTNPMEGVVVEITKNGDESKAVKKSGGEEVPAKLIEDLPILFGQDVLMTPPGEVAKGDTWTKAGEGLVKWLEKMSGEGIPGVSKVDGALECKLTSIETVEGKKIARIAISGEMEVSLDPMKKAREMMEENGEDEEGHPMGQMKIDLTMRLKKTRGEIVFNLDSSTPVSSEMHADLEIEMTQSMGEMEISGSGKGSLDVKTDYKLERESK